MLGHVELFEEVMFFFKHSFKPFNPQLPCVRHCTRFLRSSPTYCIKKYKKTSTPRHANSSSPPSPHRVTCIDILLYDLPHVSHKDALTLACAQRRALNAFRSAAIQTFRIATDIETRLVQLAQLISWVTTPIVPPHSTGLGASTGLAT